MFRTVPLSIIRSFHCTHGNGICYTGLLAACEQDQDGTFRSDPADGQRNCPKHVEFHSESKFENLVHLVGFIIRTTISISHHQAEYRLYSAETCS